MTEQQIRECNDSSQMISCYSDTTAAGSNVQVSTQEALTRHPGGNYTSIHGQDSTAIVPPTAEQLNYNGAPRRTSSSELSNFAAMSPEITIESATPVSQMGRTPLHFYRPRATLPRNFPEMNNIPMQYHPHHTRTLVMRQGTAEGLYTEPWRSSYRLHSRFGSLKKIHDAGGDTCESEFIEQPKQPQQPEGTVVSAQECLHGVREIPDPESVSLSGSEHSSRAPTPISAGCKLHPEPDPLLKRIVLDDKIPRATSPYDSGNDSSKSTINSSCKQQSLTLV